MAMSWNEILSIGGYEWAGQLVPLLLVAGVSFWLAGKDRDVMFIQLPIAIAVKMIIPFFHPAWILLSVAIFMLNILGSELDFISETKRVFNEAERKVTQDRIEERVQKLTSKVRK